jgi:alcohol dehydrogenase class IV
VNSNWNYPSNISAGAGRIAELPDACRSLDIQRPLLVTDPGLAALPMVRQALAQCETGGLGCRLFSDLRSNPCGDDVAAGVAAFSAGNHDGVIAFGGGSALDVGKAVALMSGQDRPLWDFEDSGANWKRANEAAIAPIVAVPTTAGTGSEVGRAAIITDQERCLKKIIFHPGMLPRQVILDPELTVGLPPHITAATGMDALSHNLEALCSPGYHPMAEGIAIEGIRLVREFLPVAVKDGGNLDARLQMLVASTMGATAFQKGLGAMHALAHPLGALYDAHHGLLNAILMPYVLSANQSAIEARISRLSAYIGLTEPDFAGFLSWILQLRSQLAIPHSLAEIGIDHHIADRVATMACEDPSAGGNPIAFSSAQYRQIFLRAVTGDL